MDFESVAQSLIFDVLKKKITATIVAQVPLLGVPPLSWVLGFFLNRILKALYAEGMLHLKYAQIEGRVEAEQLAADSADRKLKEAIKSGAADEIKKAKAEFKEKYAKLINMQFKP